MASLKWKRLSLSEKYKAITKVESGTKPSMVTEKYGVPRNTISTWLLPENKEKSKSAFQSCEVSTERKNAIVSLRRNS